jgi:hypothetical protein
MRPSGLLASVALLVGLLEADPARAARIVKGKVRGGAGFTVIGTSAAGEGVSRTLGPDGSFALVFPGPSARGASLQLIGPGGRYFGPIVLRHRADTAFVALAGRSINLGAVVLGEGYATPRRRLPRSAVSRSRIARADAAGRPLGAGRLGVVAAAGGGVRRVAAAEAGEGAGEDPDGDGIVNAFDADDDGDLVLDNTDPDNRGESGGMFSTLFVENLAQSLNANVGAIDPAAIDVLVRDHLNLVFFFDDAQFAGQAIVSADVDCFTLPYCAPGTGTAELTGVSESAPDLPRGRPWVDYDPNGDGLPNLEPIPGFTGGPVHATSIRPLSTTAEIMPGDAFDVIFTTPTGTIRLPRSLPPYFVTTPAVVSYDGGSGPQAISYPVAPGAPGTASAPIAMASERLTLTFYRPQRPAIAGAESGAYVDMGHLHYGIPLTAGGGEVACAGDYTDLSPTLVDAGAASGDFALQLFPLTDTADDAAPGSDRTLSFTIDLGACLRRASVDPTGQILHLGLTATGESRPGGVDRAAQTLWVHLPG